MKRKTLLWLPLFLLMAVRPEPGFSKAGQEPCDSPVRGISIAAGPEPCDSPAAPASKKSARAGPEPCDSPVRGISIAAGPARESLSLSGAWALYPLAVRWQEEFQKIRPGVNIDIQAGGAGKGVVDALAGVVDIGMVSREIFPAEVERGAVALAVAKDAVVATVNRKNPFLADILRSGLRREEFFGIWIKRTAVNWEGVLGRTGRTPIHVFTRSDACGAAETWAAYLGGHQEDLGGVGIYGDPGLAEAVRRDPLAIGFNNVNFAYDTRTLKPVAGLEICPIDLDGNGAIDPAERIYATRDDLIRAIAANVYPSPPARDLYFVIKGKPGRPLLAEFLEWVLVEGQKYVAEMGYIGLAPERIASGLAVVHGAAGKK